MVVGTACPYGMAFLGQRIINDRHTKSMHGWVDWAGQQWLTCMQETGRHVPPSPRGEALESSLVTWVSWHVFREGQSLVAALDHRTLTYHTSLYKLSLAIWKKRVQASLELHDWFNKFQLAIFCNCNMLEHTILEDSNSSLLKEYNNEIVASASKTNP